MYLDNKAISALANDGYLLLLLAREGKDEFALFREKLQIHILPFMLASFRMRPGEGDPSG
jgi:hypothetical protein